MFFLIQVTCKDQQGKNTLVKHFYNFAGTCSMTTKVYSILFHAHVVTHLLHTVVSTRRARNITLHHASRQVVVVRAPSFSQSVFRTVCLHAGTFIFNVWLYPNCYKCIIVIYCCCCCYWSPSSNRGVLVANNFCL